MSISSNDTYVHVNIAAFMNENQYDSILIKHASNNHIDSQLTGQPHNACLQIYNVHIFMKQCQEGEREINSKRHRHSHLANQDKWV